MASAAHRRKRHRAAPSNNSIGGGSVAQKIKAKKWRQ